MEQTYRQGGVGLEVRVWRLENEDFISGDQPLSFLALTAIDPYLSSVDQLLNCTARKISETEGKKSVKT
jgi:hypothetical protein